MVATASEVFIRPNDLGHCQDGEAGDPNSTGAAGAKLRHFLCLDFFWQIVPDRGRYTISLPRTCIYRTNIYSI